jgi:periplasmic protein CpxP/Spy
LSVTIAINNKKTVMRIPNAGLAAAIAIGAFVATSTVTFAQERPGAGQRERAGQPQIDRLAEQLKLTDEQKTKLQAVLREEATKMRELRQDTDLTAEQRRERVQKLREQTLAKVKPILPEDKFEQYKKLREQAAARGPRGEGGQERRGGPRQQ